MSATVERTEVVLSLFEQYYERVYCFVRRSLPPAQAEDVTQQVFLRLLERENLEKLTINVSYLLKVADNLIKRRYQRAQRFNRYLESESKRRPLVDEATDDRHPGATTAPDFGSLQAAMDRLTDNERDAVRLIICEGLSYEAAAQSLGVNVTTVNNWKFRGLRKLRAYAGEDGQSERSNPGSPLGAVNRRR